MSDRNDLPDFGFSPDNVSFSRRPRLADAVIEHLANAIVTEKYAAGTPLPTETALCDIYKVSRTVIREVSTTLAEKGLVVSQQGRGTIVQDETSWNLLDPIVLAALFRRRDGVGYLDNMIEIRTLLECAMVRKAAERITDAEAAQLQALLDRLAGLKDDPEAYARGDVEFHNLVMTVSGDRLGRAIVTSLQGQALTNRGYSGHPTISDIAETHRAHEAIAAAILCHDAEAAATEMGAHIATAWKHRRGVGSAEG